MDIGLSRSWVAMAPVLLYLKVLRCVEHLFMSHSPLQQKMIKVLDSDEGKNQPS